MRAALRSLTSLDVDDLGAWAPGSEEWAIGVRIVAGPDDGPGEESFDLTICSPSWLAGRARRDGVYDGRHYLVCERFDWPTVQAYVASRVGRCEGSTWREVAGQLGRLGYWEFEDYEP